MLCKRCVLGKGIWCVFSCPDIFELCTIKRIRRRNGRSGNEKRNTKMKLLAAELQGISSSFLLKSRTDFIEGQKETTYRIYKPVQSLLQLI